MKPQLKKISLPDNQPIPFGYKSTWFAIPCDNSPAVAETLGLTQVESCSWKSGISLAYDRKGVFLTPPIDRWILAVGAIPDIDAAQFRPCIEKLSRLFGKVFYFGTHRIVGYQAWAIANNGKLQRAFGYLGERGQFLVNFGHRTTLEIELSKGIPDPDHPPSETEVLHLASRWVLDPRTLHQRTDISGTGRFGSKVAQV